MNTIERRNILKGLAITAPVVWARPVVTGTILPAHARTSGFTRVGTSASDPCSGANEIFCGELVSGTTVGSSNDPEAGFCGTTYSNNQGVWYSFTGTGDTVIFSTCLGASYDTKLTVYSGICGSLSCEAGDDDTCGLQSEIIIGTSNGTPYLVHVHGFNGDTGSFELSVSCG